MHSVSMLTDNSGFLRVSQTHVQAYVPMKPWRSYTLSLSSVCLGQLCMLDLSNKHVRNVLEITPVCI